jgi:hypothetical protein
VCKPEQTIGGDHDAQHREGAWSGAIAGDG